MSSLDEDLKNIVSQATAQNSLQQVVRVAQQLPQDEAAKILRLSSATGDAPDVVAANLRNYDLNDVANVDWEDAFKNAPTMKGFVTSNPLAMSVVRDQQNAMTLAKLEEEHGIFAAAREGLKDVGRSFLGTGRLLTENLAAMSDVAAAQGVEGGTDGVDPAAMASLMRAASEKLKSANESSWLKEKQVTSDAGPIIPYVERPLGQVGLDVVRMLPQVVGQVGAAMAGGLPAGALFMGSQIAGSDYNQYRDDKENPVEPGRAAAAALGDAALQTPLESIGLGKIMRKIPGTTPVKERLKAYVEGGLTEAVTEWLQQYPQGAADIFAHGDDKTPAEMGQQFLEDFAKNTKEGVYQGLVALPLGVLGGAVRNSMERKATKALLDNIEAQQAVLANAPILKLSPETAERALEEVAPGEKIFLDPDALTLYQQENPQALEELGVSQEELTKAQETGEMVEVSKATYVTAVSQDPEIHQALKDDIAPATDGLTQRRIGERKDQKVVAKATESLDSHEADLREWRKDYAKQLQGGGIATDMAKQIMVGLQAHAKVMSDSPVEWLRQNAPEFRTGEAMQPGALAQQAKPSQPDIKEFADKIKADLGLSRFDLYFSRGGLELSNIEVASDARKAGTGTKAMNALIQYADQHGMRLLLTPDVAGNGRGTTSKARLVKFYKRFGFVENKGRNADHTVSHGMYRESQSASYNQIGATEKVGKVFEGVRKIAGGAEAFTAQQLRPDLEQYGGSADVSFIWGDNKKGIQHIGNKRGAETVLHVIEAVVNGQVVRHSETKKTVVIEHNGFEAVLSLDENGEQKTWLLTGWHKNKPDASGVVSAQSGATQVGPTFSRSDLVAGLLNYTTSQSNSLYQDSPGNVNGSIYWENGKAIITMMQTSNPSTVIHEMVGHFFFQNLVGRAKMDDAPERVKKDVATLFKWSGYAGKSFDDLTREERTDLHEKVARAAEAYVMTGKAPSIATQGLFRRFAEWMKQVYQTVRELGVEVTPEVAQVFDRMLATDAEIAEMESLEQYRAELPEEFRTSLTPQQLARWAVQADKVRPKAEEILRGQLMEQLSAEQKEEMAAARVAITEEVTKQVQAEPLYVVQAKLQDDFGKDPRKVAERYKAENLPEDQEAELDFVAQLHGFSSSDELATKILDNLPPAKEIAVRIEARMKAQFPDPMRSKEMMRTKAQESMYNEEGAALLAIEQQLIKEKLGAIMAADEARQRAVEVRARMRQTAQQMLAGLPIVEATRLQSYIAAERRAALDKARFLKARNLEQANLANERQQLNHALIQESLNVRREVASIKSYLAKQRKAKNWLSDTTDEAGLRVKTNEYRDQAMGIMTRFGLGSRKIAPPEESLGDWMKRQEVDEVNSALLNIAPWLASPQDKRITLTRLTMNELRDVRDAIENLKTMARIGANSDGFAFINAAGKEATIEAMLAESRKLTAAQVDKIESEKKRALDYAKDIMAGIRQPHRLLEALQGYKSEGTWMDTMYNSFKRATDRESQLMHRVYTELDAAFASEGINEKERFRNAHKKIYIAEWDQSVTKNTLLAVALNMGNQDNLARLTSMRPVGVSMQVKWDEESIKAVVEKYLDARDFRLVGKIWKGIDLYTEYNDMVRRMTGNTMPKAEPMPITFRDRTGEVIHLDGGYYPLSQDVRAGTTAELRAEAKMGDMPGMMPYPLTGRSKARSKGAKYPVDLNFGNLYGNMKETIHDISFRPVAHDINRLMRDERVVKELRTKLGEEYYKSIREWQKRISAGRAENVPHAFDAILGWAREATVVSSLLLRPGVIIQNPANVFLFGNSVDGWSNRDALRAYMKHGWGDYIPNALQNSERAKQLREFVYSKSTQMRDKKENPDYSFRELQNSTDEENLLMRSSNETAQNAGFVIAAGKQKLISFSSDAMAFTDQLTDIPMWLGAYEKAIEEGKSESEAVNFAESVIRNSTGTGRALDTSNAFANAPAAARFLTMFQTFLNTAYNRWATEFGIALTKKDAARLLTFLAVQYLAFGFASALLSFKTPDDDEDPWKWFAKEVLFWPLGTIPLAGGVAKWVLDSAMGFKTFGYTATPVESKIRDMGHLLLTAQKVYEGKKTVGDLAEPTAAVLSFIERYPDQINDWVFNAYDVLSGNMQPELRDLVKRRPSKERR
ncbi:MAG: hypothetical protein VB133_07485 [Anaeromusa sp.]|uniref:hypothetical protein n=1 Tax=Anaeromusa sp. TaxID=1872520 RepID=UPI002B2082C5|nr:hypothetical protein [Anaeromusa sp.]MEA4834958.1 hypothetical protein [Anaeromusa sp.]